MKLQGAAEGTVGSDIEFPEFDPFELTKNIDENKYFWLVNMSITIPVQHILIYMIAYKGTALLNLNTAVLLCLLLLVKSSLIITNCPIQFSTRLEQKQQLAYVHFIY